jgi:hypothetical protein
MFNCDGPFLKDFLGEDVYTALPALGRMISRFHEGESVDFPYDLHRDDSR